MYLWPTYSHSFPPPLTSIPGNYRSPLCICEFDLFRSTYKWDHAINICLSCLAYFISIAHSKCILLPPNDMISLLLKTKQYSSYVYLYSYIYHTLFNHLSINGSYIVAMWIIVQWTWECRYRFSILDLISFGYIPEVRLLGHMVILFLIF